MYLFRILVFICICSLSANAQRTCAANDIYQKKLLENPVFRKAQELMNNQINTSRSTVQGVITIPVVVHVVYNTSAENISDDQIMSQIQVLNEDFRRLNADADNEWSQAADSEIEFCLASRDTYGDATCGITRTYTDSTKFRVKKNMKFEATGGKSAWPRDEYLNIWVCDISGLLGFATFPGDPDFDEDGIVVDYLSFGTTGDLKPDFALGRTTTHEVGHWLNLRHIWGDGDCSFDDFVADTPASDDHNYGCDLGHVSCGSVDMVQNYMDYSDDVCMNLFTEGQKSRMRALFEPGGFRESLLNSQGCAAPLVCNELFISIKFDLYPEDISWNLKDGANEIIYSGDNYGTPFANTTLVIRPCLEDGDYIFSITDSYGDGLCCNEGDGNYVLYTSYKDIHMSNGQFASGETINFSLKDSKYRFVGPGTAWDDSNNWNKLDPPGDCYYGDIIIHENCEVDEITLSDQRNLIIKNGAELRIRD